MPHPTQLGWPGEKVVFGPDLVKEAEAIVHRIQDNLKSAKSCQETYANKRHRPMEFEVGDHVYLRVLPMKGVKRFGLKEKLVLRYIGPFPILKKCGTVALPMKGVKRFGLKEKLVPRYIGPFPILKKCGTVALLLERPPSLSGVHDIFHMSQLKKCLKTPVDVVLPKVILLDADLSLPRVLNQGLGLEGLCHEA
jgi:hypothetical protein